MTDVAAPKTAAATTAPAASSASHRHRDPNSRRRGSRCPDAWLIKNSL